MKIMFKNAEGEIFSIDLNPEETFGTLRSKLQLECGISLDINQFDIKGRRVSDKDLLGSFLGDESLSDSGSTDHVCTSVEIDMSDQLIRPTALECLVPHCGKSQGENPTKTFFTLPSEKERLQHWLLVCRRNDLLNEEPSNLCSQYVVCEDHFIADHFTNSDKQSLKSDAIPTLFPVNTFGRICDNSEILGECEEILRRDMGNEEDNEAETITDDSMERLCRLCASNIDEVLHIFGEKGREQEIAKKINSCLPVTVKSTDPLPKQLCSPCVLKLNVCHEFAESCIRAEDKLLRLNKRKFFQSRPLFTKENSFCSKNVFTRNNGMELEHSLQWKEEDTKLNDIGNNKSDLPVYCCPLCCEGSMRNGATLSHSPDLCGDSGQDDTGVNECNGFVNGCSSETTDAWERCHFEAVDCGESLEGTQALPEDDLSNIQMENELKPLNDVEEPLRCRICGEAFESPDLCLNHGPTHFGNDFYPCPICDLCFSTFPSFRSHSEIHETETSKLKLRPFKRVACSFCGKRFNSEKTLKNHSCGSSPRPFKCEECGKYFLTEVRLLFHQQVHQGGSAITCEYCGKMFSRENNLFDHVRLVHMGEKAHCCDQCGKTFQLKARLIAHQRVHTGERPFECDICGGKFYDKATLKGHRVTHLEVKPFQCEKCGRCFARKTLFKQHTLAHVSEERKRPRTYACRLCGGTVFSSFAKLAEHRKEAHPEAEMNEVDESIQSTKPFKCEDCGKSFAYRVTLVAHRRNHTGELPFQCEFCAKKFSQKRSLVLHRRTHTGEKPFVCLECGKRFVQSAHLYSHARLHTGEKPYACEVCGEAFRLKDVRDAHQRKHTGERPFKCTVCAKAFRTSHSYYQHMWIHQGKKPYPCSYCGKAFRRSNGLKIHIRIHTGEKPHSCDVCGRSFAQKQDMKKHRNLHVIGKL